MISEQLFSQSVLFDNMMFRCNQVFVWLLSCYLFLNSHYSSFFDHILLEFCYDTFLQRWFYKCNFFFIQVLFVARLHCKDSLEVLVLSDLNISALHTTDNQLWVKISRETVTYMVLTLQT